MKRSEPLAQSRRLSCLTLLSLATMAACSGSGGGAIGSTTAGNEFRVDRTEPVNGATIFLNDPIAIDFTTPVDLDSATLTTMTFQALDQNGTPISELVTGNFSVDKSPGDAAVGRRLLFVPRFATNNDFSDGGFKSGRTYLVQLVGGKANNLTTLRDVNGRGLTQPITFSFSTRDGTQPAQLYRNPKSGGPARTGIDITTADDLETVPLGLFGAPPLEIRLHFDQALNPNDGNVPVSFDIDPLVRLESDRGRVFLEYKDPEYDSPTDDQDFTWIPASVEIERNDLTGATLALRPAGVLPSNAEIRVIVEQTLEDISGENNLANPAYNRVFATFHTEQAIGQKWNGIAESFANSENIDFGASFPEAQAEVGPGYVRAGFAFEGTSTSLEYQPTANEIVLNTGFTQIVPKAGLPFTVAGGVFNFKNVTIPQGVTVIGQGPNPMVWLCSGRFTVAGTLTVRGGNGARVDTLNSANFAKAGGVGHCGGGNGGDGTPSATLRDLRGGAGRGPLQEAGKGGRGGYLACLAGCYTDPDQYNGSGGGSGGGGGTMATQGDPWWGGTIPNGIVPNTATPLTARSFQQVKGYGGSGCSGTSEARVGQLLPGGEPGDLVFTDTRWDNNFWGSAIDINRNLRITGELSVPKGGGGGGGGGDTSPTNNCTLTGNNPTNDFSGGGGGGGGGVLIVKALQEITITSSGHIVADGGYGGGGEQVGACGEAGGGGGGAGGMVVLMSAKKIVIEAHGDASIGTNGRFVYQGPTTPTPTQPFLGNDYDFAISADGGVCTTGGFGAVQITSKYKPAGQAMVNGTYYDGEPLGGLGGMGIVQLMVPPGENLEDQTNTRLDDNIEFVHPTSGISMIGPYKQQLLGWRGFPSSNGAVFVDDLGVTIDLGKNEGDIRPSPTLMPVPFNARSRVRSKWIDTGASERRMLASADGQPRGLVGGVQGPAYEFAGLNNSGIYPGYADYEPVGSSVRLRYPLVAEVGVQQIQAMDANASYLGEPAYRVRLASAVLGEPDQYVQYEAELLNQNSLQLVSFRVVSHDSQQLLLDPGLDLLPSSATQLRLRRKFFKISTNGAEGLGATYADGGSVSPISNVRIGFALHFDPSSGEATDRFPVSEQEYLRDFNDPAIATWLATNHPGEGLPKYIQWDVLFDMAYAPTQNSAPPSLSPSTPRPTLEFLRVPFKF